ncbi:hypothetical protein BX070DRAFT_250118 [Coemansia spiralis]|nr:hypothetical protein BX070DRAFT_250118 [Coemansia spiralis]
MSQLLLPFTRNALQKCFSVYSKQGPTTAIAAAACRRRPYKSNVEFSQRKKLLFEQRLYSTTAFLRQQQPHNTAKENSNRALLQDCILDVVEQAEELGGQDCSTWDEKKALDILKTCEHIAFETNGTCTDDVLKVCYAADRLGRGILHPNAKSFSPIVFTKYLEFYARLARPDITQKALRRNKLRCGQSFASVYAAQQLALLRFFIDKEPGSNMRILSKTTSDSMDSNQLANMIQSRLAHRSVQEIVRGAVRSYRFSRGFVKALAYASFAAVVVLIAKFAWIWNITFLVDMSIPTKLMYYSAAAVVLTLLARFALRYSVMGILTAPAPFHNSSARSSRASERKDLNEAKGKACNTSAKQISPEKDIRARAIIRNAFPGAPADEAMVELSEILAVEDLANPPRVSWQLRLALLWSRFARRFAVVEPMFVSEHGLKQRMAHMWLRNLTLMVPSDYSRSPGTTTITSRELQEFTAYVKQNFGSIPLALTANDIQAIASFVTHDVDSTAMKEFLGLVTDGHFGLMRSEAANTAPDTLDYLLNFVTEPSVAVAGGSQTSGFDRTLPSDIARHKEGAVIQMLATCIHMLSRTPTNAKNQALLRISLQTLLNTKNIPISATLYRSAFSAATGVLNSSEISRLLAESFEQRYRDGDRYVVHIIKHSHTFKHVGWKLPSIVNADPEMQNLVVGCISPYIAYLSQETSISDTASAKQDAVSKLVSRWRTVGILDNLSSLQCLCLAVRSLALLSAKELAPRQVDGWVAFGLQIADGALGQKSITAATGDEVIVRALYQLLEQALRFCVSKNASSCGIQIYKAWKMMADRHPALKVHATAAFNSLLIKALTKHPNSQMQVVWALEILDDMGKLDQTPSRQAFDALCVAAAHTNIDISKQIKHWTQNIKAKAKDQKMNALVQSIL